MTGSRELFVSCIWVGVGCSLFALWHKNFSVRCFFFSSEPTESLIPFRSWYFPDGRNTIWPWFLVLDFRQKVHLWDPSIFPCEKGNRKGCNSWKMGWRAVKCHSYCHSNPQQLGYMHSVHQQPGVDGRGVQGDPILHCWSLCYWFRREVIALSCAHRWPQQTSMCSYNPTVTHIIQVNLSRSHNKTKSYKSGTQTGRKGGNWQKHKGDTRMMRQESKSRHILRSIAADSSSQLTQFHDQSLPLHSFPLCSKKHTYTRKNNRVLHDTVVLWTSWPGNGNLIFASFGISF